MAQRQRKPHAAPRRPSDIPIGAFDSPVEAAIGRISADALDLTVDRLVDEFCDYVRDNLGDCPTQEELQHTWHVWQHQKRNMGVSLDVRNLVAKRAKARLKPAEVTAA